MSTIQQNQHPDIIFKGIDGDECEAFVAALEDLAYSEGWTEDRLRMLFFARSRLRNAALRWFVRLDPSVKNDWDLFVQALFDQYPPVSNPPTSGEVGVATPIWSATTFSPAPSATTLSANPRFPSAEEDVQNQSGSGNFSNEMTLGSSHIAAVFSFRSYDSSRLGLHVGRLRIVYEQESVPAYVWRGEEGRGVLPKGTGSSFGHGGSVKCVTFDRHEALLVSFCSDAEPHTIACPDTNHSQGDLAVALENNFAEFHQLVTTSGVRSTSEVWFSSGLACPNHQLVSKIWNVLADGTLQGTLSDFSEPPRDLRGNYTETAKPSNWTTTTVYVDPTGVPISFAKDYATPHRLHPNSNRPLLKARIVFEPL